MIMCPNCENYMSVGTKCPHCGHKDRDPDCMCQYCELKKGRTATPLKERYKTTIDEEGWKAQACFNLPVFMEVMDSYEEVKKNLLGKEVIIEWGGVNYFYDITDAELDEKEGVVNCELTRKETRNG